MTSFEEENEDGIVNYLPNELLAKIFSYLNVKELICTTTIVCRRWFNVAYDSNLWTTLTADDVKELKIHSISCIVDRLFCFNDSFRLQYLCLDRSDTAHEDLCMLPFLAPNLCQLSLAFCSNVDKSVLKLFANNCCKIQSLNVEDCEITDDCLALFSDHNITRLNVSHCNNLTDQSIYIYLASGWNIKTLNIDGVQWISDNAVECLLENSKQSLEFLWLDGDNLTDNGLTMLRNCHNIRVLKVSYCEELTNVTLTNVSEMASLTSLSLRKGKKFTKEGIIFMFQNLKNGLYHLDLYDCQGLTNEGLHWLTLTSPHVITLDLSWSWWITDEGLKHILDRCHNVQKLILIGLHELTGNLFKDTANKLPCLKYLDLTNCNSIIDDILIDVAKQIVTLTIVDYYGNVVS